MHILSQMLRIRRSENGDSVSFTLSGRIEEEHVADLMKLVENEPEVRNVTFDLEEIRLVDRQVVRFLSSCEARGLKLKNCPLYVREWMGTRKDEP